MKGKTKEIAKLSGFAFNPEALEKMLIELKDSGNFKYFIKEMEVALKNKEKSIVYEVIAAYKFKKILGYKVAFLPKGIEVEDVDVEIVPSARSGKITSNTQTPDLWVCGHGKWLYVEVKFIEEIIDKAKILRAVFTDEINHEKEGEITSSRIAGKFSEGAKQVKTFGDGFVYIFCERWKVDINKVKKKVESLFKQHPEICALILDYRTVSTDGLSTTTKPEVLFNAHSVAGHFLN